MTLPMPAGNVAGMTVGFVFLTPPTGGGVVSETVTGLDTPGDSFAAMVSANTSVPWASLLEVAATGVTATGLTVVMNRLTVVGTTVYWAHIGYWN